MYLLAAVFLLFSGAAALIYQVTWVRLLGLSMGSTSASVSTVLAAFFLGLAIGSYYAERFSRNRIHSFKAYIILEFCIGLSGLMLLPVLLNLDSIMASIPALGSLIAGKFFITMLLLCVPTICMGATFPVMAAILIRKENEIGLRLSQLYSLNTAGAIVGAISAGFIFIPNFGLDGAIYIAVLLNMTVAIVAIMFNRRINLPAFEYHHPEKIKTSDDDNQYRYDQLVALVILVGTGFSSIAAEIGWTKYLSIFTGTTIYGFAAILGIFLTGIAGGAWAIKNHLEKINQPRQWLIGLLLLAALAMLYARTGMSQIPGLYESINQLDLSAQLKQWLKYLLVFLIIFPPTFIFGAIFPLNIKLYCGNLDGVHARVGKAYAANTIASIAGSILAGFWIIPVFGTDNLLLAMSFMVLCLPLFLVVKNVSMRQRSAVITASLIVILMSTLLPRIEYKELISSVAYRFDGDAAEGKEANYLFVKEGKISVISLVTYDNEIAKVQANGLNESLIHLQDSSKTLAIESFLAYIPYMIHKNPQNAFVVGFGGGITTQAFTHTDVKNIRVVELEPAVVDAGKMLKNGPVNALNDPRVTLDFNDARNTLLVESNQYDLIAAQPSHPWRAGASNVFTQEFFSLVKSRLNEDGIYSQWINLFRMDVTTLRSLFKAFFRVFPQGVTFANLETGDLMMLGSNTPLKFDFTQMKQRMDKPGIKAALAYHDVYEPQHLLWYFALSRDEAMRAAGDSIANNDTNIFSEVRLSALLENPSGNEDPYPFLLENFQFDIIDYLANDDAKFKLYDAAMYFLHWANPDFAFLIAKQLHKLDKTLGKSVKHAIYYWRYDWQNATHWYESAKSWTDDAHLHQLEIYLKAQNWRKANETALKISDIKHYRTAQAMQLYYKQSWDTLAALKPMGNDELIWQIRGLAKQHPEQAGQKLADIIDENSEDPELLNLLVRHYNKLKNPTLTAFWKQKLDTVISNLVQRYSQLAELALNDNAMEWNMALIEKIEALNPEAENLAELKKQRKEKTSG